MAEESRTIKVRCANWDQVEAFYAQKLKGTTLVVKMPFRPTIGAPVTVALVLPDGIVFAIDGSVAKVGTPADEKFPVALKLAGLTGDVIERLRQLVEASRAPAPRPIEDEISASIVAPPIERRIEDVPVDERDAFARLGEALRRQRQLAAHEVLDVPVDADPSRARDGYLALVRRYHPDAFGRYRSAALRELAAELLIHANQAYERMRDAGARDGWLADARGVREAPFDPGAPVVPSSRASTPRPATVPPPPPPTLPFGTSPPSGSAPSDADSSWDEPDDVPFDTARGKPLTADALFDEVVDSARVTGAGAELEIAAHEATERAAAASALVPPGAGPREARELEDAGRAALAAGNWNEARERFAATLRIEPRNRPVRALYHVASGWELRSRGDDAQATIQFETALAHDRDCDEARRALRR